MRKIISILSFMVCLLVSELAFSMEMVVETTGSQELCSLKTGVERIVVLGERIVTFRDSQGMARLVSGLNLSQFSQVLVYTPSGNDFTKENLAPFPESSCTDIALAQGKIAVLILKDKDTYVHFLGL